MATVELTSIRKTFGQREILKQLDLKIQSSEFLVLVGPSGSGKSTLLRIIAGLEQPSQGHILIDDKVVNHLSPKERGIAMVFQNYALYPHMTVKENLAFSLKLSKLPDEEIEKRVLEVARTLNISEHLHKRPMHLSGGEQQRVAIGRAVARRPQVFLFDEPLSNLDAPLRVKMRSEMAHLHKHFKTTSILVTHDQVEAMTLADRLAVFNQGQIEQIGSPMDIYDDPKSMFVAGFISNPPMNFLPASLISAEFIYHGATTVGFRPDAVKIDDPHDRSYSAVGKAVVRLVEHLGYFSFVHLHFPGDYHVSGQLHNNDTVAIDQQVDVYVNVEKLFFFDQHGKRIRR